jgi:hypothetical protein
MLIDVINYIKMPQQHDTFATFASFQRLESRDLPVDKQRILEPVKPVVTRWNSFCSAF